LSNSINGMGGPPHGYGPDDEEEPQGAEPEQHAALEDWPSPYVDPGAPPPTGISTPSSHGSLEISHSPYVDPGAPPTTGISTPSSHRSPEIDRSPYLDPGAPLRTGLSARSSSQSTPSSGERRPEQPLSPRQSTGGASQTIEAMRHVQELHPPPSSVRAAAPEQPVASTSRSAARPPRSRLAPPPPVASGSQAPLQRDPPTAPERARRRRDPWRPYTLHPAPAGHPHAPALGGGLGTQPAPPLRFGGPANVHQQPAGPTAAQIGGTLLSMTNRQRRQAFTPHVLELSDNGQSVDQIFRATNLPKPDIERILRENHRL
jgi:hypothetical protein